MNCRGRFQSWPFALLWLAASAPVPAYELTYAPTGYAVSSGMDYAIRYELNQLITRHEQLFRRKVPREFKLTYYVFPTFEEYRDHAAKSGQKLTRKVLGFTQSSAQFRTGTGEIFSARAEVVTWRHELAPVLIATLLHETTHAVTQAFLLRVPLWMKEGSADWFGKPAWAESDAQKKDRARRWRTLKLMLDEQRLPALRTYLDVEDYEDWGRLFGGNVSMGYVLGYSLFDYFMAHPQSTAFLSMVLRQLDPARQSSPSASFTVQLDQHWRGGLATFEKGWHNWIKQQAAKEGSATAPSPKTKP